MIRNELGEILENGTVIAKFIPQADIERYLDNTTYVAVGGFVSEAEYSKNLKGLEQVYERKRLDYISSQYSLSNATYGKITYRYSTETEISVLRYEPTADSYPYTGKGFTASKNIILPEWKQERQAFQTGDLLEILDAKTGDVIKNINMMKENGYYNKRKE